MLLPQYTFRNDSLGEVLLDLSVRFVVNCPPADLSTAERLFFQIEEAHWFYEDFARVDNQSLPAMKLRTFVDRIFTAVPYLYQYQPDPLEALTTFQSYKSLIPVRGGIILNEKMDKVLMVKGWRGSSWGFPKGKINQNEPDSQCAVREVYEETGFDMGPYIKEEDYFEVTRQGKNIRLYVIRGVPEDTVFETQTRKEISKIGWHAVHKLPGFNKHTTNTSHYYMAAPFMSGLKKYINKSKGLATSLTSKETKALKNVLDAQDSFPNDEEAAKNLLSLLKPAKQTSDTAILLNLIKGNKSSDIENAQQVLGLYQTQMSAEQPLVEPVKIVLPESYHGARQSSSAPPLPPSSLLQTLVASRQAKGQGAGLLSILGGGSSAGQPTSQAPVAASGAPANDLLSLLRSPPSAAPAKKPANYLMSLLNKPSAPACEPAVSNPHPASASNELTDLLAGPSKQPEADAVLDSAPESLEPDSVAQASPPEEPAFAAEDAAAVPQIVAGDVSLMHLLNKPATIDNYPSVQDLAKYLGERLGTE